MNNLSLFERFNLFYPRFIQAVTEFSNIIFVFLRNVITTLFIPVILVLVIMIEVVRVESGISIFDNDLQHARFSAIVVVLSFIVFQTLDHYIKEREGFVKKPVWNIKLFFGNLLYRIGIGESRYKPQSTKYTFVSNLLKWAILLIATVGTMQEQIRATGDTVWYEAIVQVFINSNLEIFTGWIISLVFTVVLVYASGTLAYHIAATASEALIEIRQRSKNIEKSIRRHTMLTPQEFARIIKSRKLNRFAYLEDDKFAYDEASGFVVFYDSLSETETEFNLHESSDKARLFKYLTENRGYENNSDQ